MQGAAKLFPLCIRAAIQRIENVLNFSFGWFRAHGPRKKTGMPKGNCDFVLENVDTDSSFSLNFHWKFAKMSDCNNWDIAAKNVKQQESSRHATPLVHHQDTHLDQKSTPTWSVLVSISVLSLSPWDMCVVQPHFSYDNSSCFLV